MTRDEAIQKARELLRQGRSDLAAAAELAAAGLDPAAAEDAISAAKQLLAAETRKAVLDSLPREWEATVTPNTGYNSAPFASCRPSSVTDGSKKEFWRRLSDLVAAAGAKRIRLLFRLHDVRFE